MKNTKEEQTQKQVAGRKQRLVMWFLRTIPDWEWKRDLCGGVWIHYHTSLPMGSVWQQCANDKSTPPRQPCEISRIKTERLGVVRYNTYT